MVDFSVEELLNKLRSFLDPKKTEALVEGEFSVGGGTARKLLEMRKDFRRDFEKNAARYCIRGMYRVFDRRAYYFKREYLKTNSERIMKHLMQPGNRALVAFRQQSQDGFHHIFVTNELSDKNAVSLRTREVNYYFPLYVLPDSEGVAIPDYKSPNLSARVLQLLRAKLDVGGVSGGKSSGQPTPEETFDYSYAVFHSPGYRSRYSQFLKSDFPRLPLPGSVGVFRDLVPLGRELVALHLMEAPKLDQFISTYTGPKNPEVGRIGWSDDTVWLDAAATKKGQLVIPGTIGFRGVPEAVWNFHIGGYQVCEKWLKDRKGRTLSKADITHYQKIVVALRETIRLMGEIDRVIDEHGGWPGAFQGSEGSAPAEALDLPRAAEKPAAYDGGASMP